MAKFRLTCTGTVPLLMHNPRLANPLDEVAKSIKRISAKRNKTEADHEEMARLEHIGGLYFDPEVGPFLPGHMFEASLTKAARITKSGLKIERGVFIETDVNPLSYDGPRTIEGLWEDKNFRHMASVVVSRNRIMRTRPQFRPRWVVEADGMFDPSVINLEELTEIATTAGQMTGLGDWHPRYGRFTAGVEQIG